MVLKCAGTGLRPNPLISFGCFDSTQNARLFAIANHSSEGADRELIPLIDRLTPDLLATALARERLFYTFLLSGFHTHSQSTNHRLSRRPGHKSNERLTDLQNHLVRNSHGLAPSSFSTLHSPIANLENPFATAL